MKTGRNEFAVKRHNFLLAFLTRAPKLGLANDEVGNEPDHRCNKQNAQPSQSHPMILLVVEHTQHATECQHGMHQYQCL